jgi:hypothetical protein
MNMPFEPSWPEIASPSPIAQPWLLDVANPGLVLSVRPGVPRLRSPGRACKGQRRAHTPVGLMRPSENSVPILAGRQPGCLFAELFRPSGKPLLEG